MAELEKNYIGLAAELEAKVEQQQRDQLQRLKADHVQMKGWLSQYLADLKAAKEQVRFDPLDQLTEDVQKFKEGQ